MKDYLDWDEKIDEITGKVIKFDEEKYVEDWWKTLLPRQKADVYRMYKGDDPIQDWNGD